MYFPVLENLKTNKVNPRDIELLDWWVGTRKKNTWKYLNPLQYSLDCGINHETAISLFALCTLEEDISLFQVRSVTRCPNCKEVVAKEYDSVCPTNFPSLCEECGEILLEEELKNETEVYFSLQVDPVPPKITPSAPLWGKKEVAQKLKLTDLKELSSSQSALNKLFDI